MTDSYKVSELYVTIQGEGSLTGTPMFFLRLQGCDVGCPWCDTKHTWDATGGRLCGAAELAAEVETLRNREAESTRWVCVTGGEPAQQNLKALVDALHDRSYSVALETSGTALGFVDAGFDWVCVSPKENMPGGLKLRPEALVRADELKFVVGRKEHVDDMLRILRTYPQKENAEIFLQPLSQSEKATAVAVEACKRYGFNLSVQTHKVVGLP